MKLPEIPEDGQNRVTLEIEEGYSAGERLDVLVTNRLPKISRSRVKRLVSEGRICINGKPGKASTVVNGGDVIEVTFPHPPRPPASPEEIPLDIVFEDLHLLIVNKPAGMVVHPAAGHHSGTLVNALLALFDKLPNPGGGPSHRPGIVHRLDKDTSGLIVIAKTEELMTSLGRLFHEHDIDREYRALVWGDPPERGTINAPIKRHPNNRKKFAVQEDGKHAVTHWEVEERFSAWSLLKVTLETGRTHQIRVHMSSQGWPVFGDTTYGGTLHGLDKLNARDRELAREALNIMPHQALHAGTLGFIHPISKEHVLFRADVPQEYKNVLELFRTG